LTGDELTAARHAIGHARGLGRALTCAELGRDLRLKGDVQKAVTDMERRDTVTGPIAVAVEFMRQGLTLPHMVGAQDPPPLNAIRTREPGA